VITHEGKRDDTQISKDTSHEPDGHLAHCCVDGFDSWTPSFGPKLKPNIFKNLNLCVLWVLMVCWPALHGAFLSSPVIDNGVDAVEIVGAQCSLIEPGFPMVGKSRVYCRFSTESSQWRNASTAFDVQYPNLFTSPYQVALIYPLWDCLGTCTPVCVSKSWFVLIKLLVA